MGRTSKNIKLRIPEKPRKIKGFRSGSYRVATTISSQGRYNHFDTTPRRSILYHSADQPFCQALRCGFTWRLYTDKFLPIRLIYALARDKIGLFNRHLLCCRQAAFIGLKVKHF